MKLLGIQFAYIGYRYVGQTSGKLSGCQGQFLLKRGYKFEYVS